MCNSIIRCINECGQIAVTLNDSGVSVAFTFSPENIVEYADCIEIIGGDTHITINPDRFRYYPEDDEWLSEDGNQQLALI